MKKVIRRIKKKPILIFTAIFFLLFLLSSICLIYSILRVSNIENILRYMISSLLVIVNIYVSLSVYKIIFRGKNLGIIAYDILLIILFVIFCFITITINGLYSSISNIHKDTYSYSASLIGLSDNKISLKDIKNLNIAISNKENNNELYEISTNLLDENDFISTNNIIEYNNSTDMLKDLYDKKVDLIILPSNYISIYSAIDDYSNINEDTYELSSKTKTIKKEISTNNKSEKDPFTVLVLGMDSTIKDISTVTSFNADSLMLITFNPNTLNATILSIPRDTYVPISCYNKLESKITHSGWNGESCVIGTIENLMDIKIDYYVKVNFTAVVNLVDEIGGIEVDVPYSFCEQDSNRRWGSYTVYVEKGLQTLSGEQALALSRNRHPNLRCGSKYTNYYSSDIVRGENQQAVLNALLNKIVKSISYDKITKILSIIGTNVDTNMNINEMTSYYNVLKKVALDKDNVINFERLQLSTYGKSLYDPLLNMNGMSMQIYYKESLNAIIKEMKINLGIEKPEIIKTVTFSINNPYEEETIGKGTYYQSDIQTVPNFIGSDLSVAQTWASNNGINLIVEYEDNNENENNSIISQSVSSTYRMDMLNKNNPFKVVVAQNYYE